MALFVVLRSGWVPPANGVSGQRWQLMARNLGCILRAKGILLGGLAPGKNHLGIWRGLTSLSTSLPPSASPVRTFFLLRRIGDPLELFFQERATRAVNGTLGLVFAEANTHDTSLSLWMAGDDYSFCLVGAGPTLPRLFGVPTQGNLSDC